MIISLEKLPEECGSILREFEVRDSDVEPYLQDAEVLMTWPSKAASFISKMPKLRVIQTFSAGVDDLPFQYLNGVTVLSNAGAYSTSVAEHAWALALSLAKGVNSKRRGSTYSVTGRVALIVGAGGIGSEIARIAMRGFSMKVIGISRSFRRPEFFDERLTPDQLPRVISNADFVFVSLPLNRYTRGILNYEVLKAMKEYTILVNVGRAETIVEEDIFRLLKERDDLRFGTDVFWRKEGKENFESPLWSLPNFAGTLHTAGASASGETLRQAMISACKNLATYLREGKSDNLVKLEDYL
ncbi:3-phosphoglycerate dehydrogenase [Metallosphaera tengchongensis]|uniref:3-phosphoglycerate dehydrogenase n=1 Tax=Metallosphaera tengchongensis TaxID=1532350 RepID=A0A6N0NXN9_9CREN|nr:2-hydroxyacid dehydrogenase [Metallosphaera tengchongensis]QKR00633.1 3-phosphoglycerate dehydrogenase [Metallosphaera tengchongensis]